MPLTPADVHNVAFSKPPIGKRGYNEDEVDAFLDLVENELTRLIEENTDLRQRVSELDQEAAPAPAPGAARRPPRRFRCTSPSPSPNRSPKPNRFLCSPCTRRLRRSPLRRVRRRTSGPPRCWGSPRRPPTG